MKKCILLSGKSITLNLFFQEFINLFNSRNLKVYTSDPINFKNKNYYHETIFLPRNYKELFNFYFI